MLYEIEYKNIDLLTIIIKIQNLYGIKTHILNC